ncbi:hypothetical protein [Thermogymnomonas acidicola]|uniref:alkaline phosphatase family protein n=1 Tax=Thermogymnomonas acidicola TaxID=399579 RepID=UPI000946470E|nr:alkaline phosphatase family protein [Thermogymnomonas acidicola]
MKWTCILAALLILSAAIPGGLRVQGVHEGYAQAYAAGENSTRTPIRHVVNIFLENHSFDNMFEIFPENRFTGNATLSSQLSRPLNLLNNTSILSMLHQVPYGCFTTPDPYEGYVQYHIDWAHGKMDGFLQGSGPQSLTYYTADQMAPEWDFAEEYAIADNYFAPQISESMPNHLYYIAGFSPVINDYGPPPPYVPFSETIFGELQHYGISWGGFYIMNASMPFPELAIVQGLAEHRQNIQSWAQFVQEARNGDLPAVSYLYSQGSFDDQGPPDNVLNGELFLLYVVDLLERSPRVEQHCHIHNL